MNEARKRAADLSPDELRTLIRQGVLSGVFVALFGWTVVGLLLGLILSGIQGCGGSAETTGPGEGGSGGSDQQVTATCEPGATQECVCSGGEQGGQVCADDGSTWEACECEPETLSDDCELMESFASNCDDARTVDTHPHLYDCTGVTPAPEECICSSDLCCCP